MDMNNNSSSPFKTGSKDDLVVERKYSYEEVTRETDSPIFGKRWGLSAAALSFLNPTNGGPNMLTNGSYKPALTGPNGYTTSIMKKETEKKMDKNSKSTSLVVTTKTHKIEKKDQEEEEEEGWRKFLHEVKSLSQADDAMRRFDLVSAESKTTEIEEGSRPNNDSMSWKKMATKTYEYKTIA